MNPPIHPTVRHGDALHFIEPLEARVVPARVIAMGGLDGSDGFTLVGKSVGDSAGQSVSHAGDVNGDGYGDVIVGAPRGGQGTLENGAAYVVFGSADGIPAQLDFAALDGKNGFQIAGEIFDFAGWSVSGAGDVNGDGFDDVIVGTYISGDDHLRTYVVFGQRRGFPAKLKVEDLDGKNGFVLTSAAYDSNFGSSVSGAGDVNGDGFADLIVGAPYASSGTTEYSDYVGASYVVFGRGGVFPAALEVTTLDGTDGFVIEGSVEELFTGRSVSGAGDVNGDGVDDVIVGGTDFSGSYGAAYVVYGRTGGFAASVKLGELDGSDGFELSNTSGGYDFAGYFGTSVSDAGDVNGDGFDDVIIGAPVAGYDTEGTVYVVYGRPGSAEAVRNVGALNGSDGFILYGAKEYDYTGRSVAGAGDVNGDGFADVIVSAGTIYGYGASPGRAYVVFGGARNAGGSVALGSLTNAQGWKLVEPAAEADWSVSGAGDVNGDGISDVIVGAPHAFVENGNVPAAGKCYVVFGKASPRHLDSKLVVVEPDGDVVTIALKGGALLPKDVRLDAMGAIEKIDLTRFGAEHPLRLRVTVETPLAGTGDGSTIVGTVDATGAKLTKLKIAGDLGQLLAGTGKGLLQEVAIAGDFGTASAAASAVAAKVGSFVVGGDLAGVELRATRIATLHVAGSMADAAVLTNKGFGVVAIGGDFVASSIAAGVAPGPNGFFGDSDDILVANIAARIAAITIDGQVMGTAATGDHFGIVAGEIDKLKIGGVTQVVVRGTPLQLGWTGDVTAQEVTATA